MDKFVLALATLVVILLASCGNPTSPSEPNITGTWNGQAQDNIGTYFLTLTIMQSGTYISGVFSSSSGLSGNISGTINGESGDFTMTPSDPLYCPYYAIATFKGTTATGQYAAVNCSISVSGTFNLTKQ